MSEEKEKDKWNYHEKAVEREYSRLEYPTRRVDLEWIYLVNKLSRYPELLVSTHTYMCIYIYRFYPWSSRKVSAFLSCKQAACDSEKGQSLRKARINIPS